MLDRAQLLSILPEREDFALLYRYLRRNGGYRYKLETLMGKLDYRLTFGKIRIALEAMRELGLIEVREGLKCSKIILGKVSRKVDLESAPIIRKLREVTR